MRGISRGLMVGGLLTALTLAAFPHFYGRMIELAVFPLAFAVLGVVVRAPLGLWRLARGRARPVRPPSARMWSTVAAALLLPMVLFALRAPARNWRVSPRMMVLCIDGGTWNIIDPLIDAGRMPMMAQLREGGVSGVLMSTEPAFTPIVWTTIGTGVEPEQHGITTFYSTQDQLRHKRIWELVEENGHSVGMFRWLVTWPPHPADGFIIPDLLAKDERCFPPRYNFINKLRIQGKQEGAGGRLALVALGWKLLRADVRMETCLASAREMIPALASRRYADFHIAARRMELRLNADLYCHLLRAFKPEYTCLYDNGADVLSHFYWRYLEPDVFPGQDADDVARYGGAIPDYYALNDRVFGRVVSHLDPATAVVVLSDHGSAADTAGAEVLYFPRAQVIVDALGLNDACYGIALGALSYVVPLAADSTARTAAAVRAMEALNGITVEESGARIFDAWIDADRQVVLGVSDELTTLDGTVRAGNASHQVEAWFTTQTFYGTHVPQGIYAFSGPAFRAGLAGPTIDLVDVAPTLLHLAGIALSRELAGEVVWEAFTEEFRNARDVAWRDSYGRFDTTRTDPRIERETLEKLRSLGYVR